MFRQMMWSMPHHYLAGCVVQAHDQETVCLFHRIDFQLQIGTHVQCERSQVEGYTEVVPREPFCVRNRLFRAKSRLCQSRLCLVPLCFQLTVAFRVQADYR